MQKIKFIFFLFFANFIIIPIYAQKDSSFFSYNYKYYIYVGGSVSAWYKSEQPLMKGVSPPVHIFINIGKHKGILGLKLDLTVNQTFRQDFVILKSYFLTAALDLNTRKLIPKRYGAFIYGGPNIWYSTLSFENTTYLEKYKSWGFDVSGGLYYMITPFIKISTSIIYQSSAKGAWFYAGSIHLQNVGVGSYQFLLSLSYNLL